MSIVNWISITIIILLFIIGFTTGLTMEFGKQQKDWANQPCSAYVNTPVKNVPFRCVPGMEIK